MVQNGIKKIPPKQCNEMIISSFTLHYYVPTLRYFRAVNFAIWPGIYKELLTFNNCNLCIIFFYKHHMT